MHHSLRWLLPLLVAVVALPPAAATSFFSIPGGLNVQVPVASMQEQRTRGTLLQQYDFSCGSAALATLLSHHYGRKVNEQEVLEAMYATGDQQKIRKEGFSMLDMKRYLESLGYAADGFQQTLDKLAQARLPAIVLVNESNYHHFVVVKGMRDGRVLIGDPSRGLRTMDRADFEEAWVGGLLFVIHNRIEEARFDLAEEWQAVPRSPLGAAVRFEGLAGPGLPKHGPGDF